MFVSPSFMRPLLAAIFGLAVVSGVVVPSRAIAQLERVEPSEPMPLPGSEEEVAPLQAIDPAFQPTPGARNILLTGFWPPTNEMLRQFSPNATQNPGGWVGRNWEGRGYDVYAFFPEFPNGVGKGEGDFEVDYQDASDDFWEAVDLLDPVALITFSRAYNDRRWILEGGNRMYASWIGDYLAPVQPSPDLPIVMSEPPGFERFSSLPMDAIAANVLANVPTLVPEIRPIDPSRFVSNYTGYHGNWYHDLHADPFDPRFNVAGGHIHVGFAMSVAEATAAAEVSVRTLLDHVDGVLGDLAYLDHDGDGTPDLIDLDDDADGLQDDTETRAALAGADASLYLVDQAGQLVVVDLLDAGAPPQPVGTPGPVLGDLALAPDGGLLGVTFETPSRLFYIDATTAATTLVGSLPAAIGSPNAFAVGPDGRGYVAGPGGAEIWSFPATHPEVASVWHAASSGVAAGDLVFVSGALYLAWDEGGVATLRRFDLGSDGNVLGETVLGRLPTRAWGLSKGPLGTLILLADDADGNHAAYHLPPPPVPLDAGEGDLPMRRIEAVVPDAATSWYAATSSAESRDTPTADTDGDGVPDARDLDSDGDTILDVVEAGLPDVDDDGRVDHLGLGQGSVSDPLDQDGDGLPDFVDLESGNPVNDGTEFDLAGGGWASLDANGDGMFAAPDPFGGHDENANGIEDHREGLDVPEPAALLQLLVGTVGLAGLGRARKRG